MMPHFSDTSHCPHCQQTSQSLARVNALLVQLLLDYQNQLVELEKSFLELATQQQAQAAQFHQVRATFYISLKQAKREFHKDFALVRAELSGLVTQPAIQSPVTDSDISDS